LVFGDRLFSFNLLDRKNFHILGLKFIAIMVAGVLTQDLEKVFESEVD